MKLCHFMQASHKFLNEGNQFFLRYNKKIQVFYLRLDTPFCALFTSPPLSFPIRFTRINKSHSLSNLCFFCTLQRRYIYTVSCAMQKIEQTKLKKDRKPTKNIINWIVVDVQKYLLYLVITILPFEVITYNSLLTWFHSLESQNWYIASYNDLPINK